MNNSVEGIAEQFKTTLLEGKDILTYAFNTTGKTRLSMIISDNEAEQSVTSLSYNAIFEDLFRWDNENCVLEILNNGWPFDFIEEEGLDGLISDCFRSFIDVNIRPNIDFTNKKIEFKLIDQDADVRIVKISKGEESLFKWSVFYVTAQRIIEILEETEENRSTKRFNNLKFIIIDDPISFMDDFRVYTVSSQILSLMQYIHTKNLNITFLILTHHSLFYNIMQNTLKNRNVKKREFYFLEKHKNETLLKSINDKTMVSHILMLRQIKEAIEENQVKKICFNMFRSILEKCSIFLGYQSWQDLFKDYEDKDKANKLLNMNSHERYAEIESEYLTSEQVQILSDCLDYFLDKYKIKLGE